MAEFKYKNLTQEEQDKLDAATFRRFIGAFRCQQRRTKHRPDDPCGLLSQLL